MPWHFSTIETWALGPLGECHRGGVERREITVSEIMAESLGETPNSTPASEERAGQLFGRAAAGTTSSAGRVQPVALRVIRKKKKKMAGCEVCCEPVSGRVFPDTRQFTGNLREKPAFR